MTRSRSILLSAFALTLAIAPAASAQPDPRPAADPAPQDQPAPSEPADPYGPPPPAGDEPAPTPPTDPSVETTPGLPPEPAPPVVPPEDNTPRVWPQLFAVPTARMLRGAAFYSSTGLDTSGGLSSDARIGLGDVAEFGIALVDQIRSREPGDEERERVSPYFLATFRMGVPEHRLFRHQPALAIGFRKSFQAEDKEFESRVASLYVVASKSLFGDKLALHGGAMFWDAELEAPDGSRAFLHDSEVRRQLRGFGGLEIQALDRAHIIVEWTYWPQLTYSPSPTPADISLVAQLAWGVRYHVSKSVLLESGVRVDDIQDANLIDAQIFGQLTFSSHVVRNWLASIR